MAEEGIKQNKELLKNFEKMTNYMNLIPFKLDELSITEKLILADNLFYEYFSSLDESLLKTLSVVEEKVDPKKVQADKTKYVEFIITKLLIKMIEQADNHGTNSADVLEGVFEAVKIFGLPSSQKYKIIVFSLSKLMDAVEAPDQQLSLTLQIKNLLNQFYIGLFKDSSFTDLANLIQSRKGSNDSLNITSKNYHDELQALETKKNKSYEYLVDFIVPYIIVQLRFLSLKAPENAKEPNKTDEDKHRDFEDLKKMIGIFWELLQQINYQKYTEESKLGTFKDVIDKIWSNKLLATLKALFNFFLYLFKENYSNLPEENEFPHSSLTIRLNATYLFSDSPEFMYLRNNKEEFREHVPFSNYLHEKTIIMKFISLIGKAQKRIIKYTFEKEAFVQNDNSFAATNKNEFKFQKDLMGVEIEKSKSLFIIQAYQKTIKKLLQCMNIATYSKVNPFEKLPKVLNKSMLFEILLVSFYCLNGTSEDRFEDYDLGLITSTIANFPPAYIDLIYYPTILEKLFERFYNEPKLVDKLIERIKMPEVYQTNFEWKYSKSANQAKINFIRSTYKYFIENRI